LRHFVTVAIQRAITISLPDASGNRNFSTIGEVYRRLSVTVPTPKLHTDGNPIVKNGQVVMIHPIDKDGRLGLARLFRDFINSVYPEATIDKKTGICSGRKSALPDSIASREERVKAIESGELTLWTYKARAKVNNAEEKSELDLFGKYFQGFQTHLEKLNLKDAFAPEIALISDVFQALKGNRLAEYREKRTAQDIIDAAKAMMNRGGVSSSYRLNIGRRNQAFENGQKVGSCDQNKPKVSRQAKKLVQKALAS
jgi:hypothetical protein